MLVCLLPEHDPSTALDCFFTLIYWAIESSEGHPSLSCVCAITFIQARVIPCSNLLPKLSTWPGLPPLPSPPSTAGVGCALCDADLSVLPPTGGIKSTFYTCRQGPCRDLFPASLPASSPTHRPFIFPGNRISPTSLP